MPRAFAKDAIPSAFVKDQISERVVGCLIPDPFGFDENGRRIFWSRSHGGGGENAEENCLSNHFRDSQKPRLGEVEYKSGEGELQQLRLMRESYLTSDDDFTLS